MSDALPPNSVAEPPASSAALPPVTLLTRQDRLVIAELPRPLTALIGREQESVALRDVLSEPSLRLITLTGPGGVGKTRLALDVAASVTAVFPDGVCFVPLAAITAPELVLQAVAQQLHLRDDGGLSLPVALARLLRERKLLLMLDNFEQVVSAAPEIASLLAACPNLTVLATSRTRLRVSGEQAFPLEPLPLPEGDPAIPLAELAENPAISLFTMRVRAVQPAFAVTAATAPIVGEICRRLDGLPLAIELAAARSNVLPPAPLLARLSARLPLLIEGVADAPPRQRTLRATIAWSYDLLTPEEQLIFRRLAVFAGPFPLEAVEWVMPDGEETSAIALRRVAALVDHNLLRLIDDGDTGPRFAMLETIREFAAEALVASGEEAVMRRRHADYVSSLAVQPESEIHGAQRWLRRLTMEVDNVWAALDWAVEQPESDLGLRLTGALWPFWYGRGEFSLGRHWLERALANADRHPAAASPAARATALCSLGALACFQSDFAVAEPCLTEALALRQSLNDRADLAEVLILLGCIAQFTGDGAGAGERFGQALALARAGEHLGWTTAALERQADVAYRQGDYKQAVALATEALAVARAAGEPVFVVHALVTGAQSSLARGDHAATLMDLRECLAAASQMAYVTGIADTLVGFAGLATACDQAELAARWLGTVAAAWAALGLKPRLHEQLYRQVEAATRAALGDKRYEMAYTAGQARSLAEVSAEALDFSPVAAPAKLPPGSNLTDREREILALLAQGLSNREIAERLSVSVPTVKAHVSNILSKLDVTSRTAAALYAREHGLV